MDSGKKVLLFPVETIVRELDFRLVLAGYCARPGHQIFLGNHTDIYELGRRMEGGLYVGKNLLNVSPTRMTSCYEEFKERRFRVVHLDEEGAIYRGGPEDWKKELIRKFDPRWLEAEDHACAWGPFQAEVFRGLQPRCRDNIRVTGHPRLNLPEAPFAALYEEETRALRERFGDFLLVNTNFTRGNFGTRPDYFFIRYKVQPEDGDLRRELLEEIAYENARLGYYIQFINRLSDAFPSHRIILRPHPSENLERYRGLLQHVPRVHLETAGNLTAWLRAASCLIHAGCTTAIEAFATGTPIINYQPLKQDQFEKVLPNYFGTTCLTEDEALERVRETLAGRQPEGLNPEGRKTVRDLIANLGAGTEAFASFSELVLQVLEEVKPTVVTGSLTRFPMLGRRERARGLLRRLNPLGASGRPVRDPYRQNRFPGLDPGLIRKKLEIVHGLTGRRLRPTFFSSKLMRLDYDS